MKLRESVFSAPLTAPAHIQDASGGVKAARRQDGKQPLFTRERGRVGRRGRMRREKCGGERRRERNVWTLKPTIPKYTACKMYWTKNNMYGKENSSGNVLGYGGKKLSFKNLVHQLVHYNVAHRFYMTPLCAFCTKHRSAKIYTTDSWGFCLHSCLTVANWYFFWGCVPVYNYYMMTLLSN